MSHDIDRAISPRDTDAMVGISRSQRYRLEAAGLFPSRIKLSDRRSAYRLSELREWLDSRPRARASEQRP